MGIKNWFWLALLWAGVAQAMPEIQTWRTPGGAKVLFVESHDLPLLDVSVKFPAGSAFDPAQKAGLAELTSALLRAGSTGHSEAELASALADVGAEWRSSSGKDHAVLTLRTLSQYAPTALALLATALQQPLFPAEALAREQSRLSADIREGDTQPPILASRALERALFGAHPYAVSATVASVARIQRDDVLAFYRQHYQARHAVLALVGDITRAQAEAIAQQLTAHLPSGAALTLPPPADNLPAAREVRQPHPASQTHILLGAPGVARNDPDYDALYVGNYILGGGGFASRLMHEVREKRGLAYSVYSYFMPYQQRGAFMVGLQTQKSQAEQALQLVRSVLAEFFAKGVTPAELRATQQHIINGFPLRLDSNRKLLEQLSNIGFYDLPADYLQTYPQRIQRVTAADIQAAFARHIAPHALATVLVGAPETARETK